MGFVSEVLGGEKGIQIYYIIGMLIFIGLFLVILRRTYKMSKSDIMKYKTSILDLDNENTTNSYLKEIHK